MGGVGETEVVVGCRQNQSAAVEVPVDQAGDELFALRVERRTSTHAGGRTVPGALPTMSMPILLRAGALAARVRQVDELADVKTEILDTGAAPVLQAEPTGDAPSAVAAPPDLQAAASDLNLTCLSLAPRLAAAPSIRVRVSPRAWLMPCVSRSSG